MISALAFHPNNLPEVGVHPQATSYFSQPEDHLDPRLFDENNRMHEHVRQDLHDRFRQHMGRWSNHSLWAKAWLAGSGASYQWSAAREPGDLDMLVGIDYPVFRAHNQEYARVSDDEISRHITDTFRQHLTPTTAAWSPDGESRYEVTWYANPKSTDIRAINPYAAYDVSNNHWAVEPDPTPFRPPSTGQRGQGDLSMAKRIVDRYSSLRRQMAGSVPAVNDANSKAMAHTLAQAHALWEDIHGGRHYAFTQGGRGYADPANARWQEAKANGVAGALKSLSDILTQANEMNTLDTYGVALPGSDELLMRAVLNQIDR